jgi:hypothetical protein
VSEESLPGPEPDDPPPAPETAPEPVPPPPTQESEATPEGTEAITPAPEPVTVVERRVLRATQIQAGAALISVAVSVLALLVSALAYVNQQRANDVQTALSDRAGATGVAVWAVPKPDESSVLPAGLDVSIQNRSSSQIVSLRLIAPVVLPAGGDAKGTLSVELIPPCSVATLRLVPPAGGEFSGEVTALFFLAGKSWRLDGGGLARVDPAGTASAGLRQLRGLQYRLVPLPGCAGP